MRAPHSGDTWKRRDWTPRKWRGGAAGDGGDRPAGAPSDLDAEDEPDLISWILEGLTSIQAPFDDTKAFRHAQAIGYFVEHWARTDPQRLATAVDRFLDGPALSGTMPPERRAALLASVADGYWWAGLAERARDINRRAREVNVAGPWVQLGLFHLAAGERAAATDAFTRAIALSPDRGEVTFFLARLDPSVPVPVAQ